MNRHVCMLRHVVRMSQLQRRAKKTSYSSIFCFSPTCQVRVVRFYASLPASSFLFLRRTSTASSGSQCSPPNPNTLPIAAFPAGPISNLWIKVFPGAPASQAPDQSVPCRTSTASSRSDCSSPDLDHKESPKMYQIECQRKSQKMCQIHMPQRKSDINTSR